MRISETNISRSIPGEETANAKFLRHNIQETAKKEVWLETAE